MTIIQAIILGILQGATEFIPVSSSGHLVLVPWLVGWDSPGLTFDVAVHFGTMLAVLITFRRDWLAMANSAWRWFRTREGNDPSLKLLGLLIIGSIPAAVIGGLFDDYVERIFENPLVAALMLLVTAGLLFIGEEVGRQTRNIDNLKWRDSVVVGFAQALAIMPGISRSGATITAGRLRSLKREDAARFSFMLATPIIAGAGVFKLLVLVDMGIDVSAFLALICGFLAAFTGGYAVIRWLLGFLRTRPTTVFAVYCVLASVCSLIVWAIRMT